MARSTKSSQAYVVNNYEPCHMDTRKLLAAAQPPVREDDRHTIWTEVLANITELKAKLDAADSARRRLVPIPGKTIKVHTASGVIEVPAMRDETPDTRPYKERLGTFRPDVEE